MSLLCSPAAVNLQACMLKTDCACTTRNRISLIYAAPDKWEGQTAMAAFVLAVLTKEMASGVSKICRGAAGVSSDFFPPQQPAKHA